MAGPPHWGCSLLLNSPVLRLALPRPPGQTLEERLPPGAGAGSNVKGHCN